MICPGEFDVEDGVVDPGIDQLYEAESLQSFIVPERFTNSPKHILSGNVLSVTLGFDFIVTDFVVSPLPQ